jgi:hypothetical protein
LAIFPVVLAAAPTAKAAGDGVAFTMGSGVGFLRGGQTSNQGSPTPYVDAEFAWKTMNGKALFGLFFQASIATSTTGSPLYPLFYGLFFRGYLGGIKRLVFFDVKLDPVGMMVATIIRPPIPQPFFDFVNWAASVGFRIAAGKALSIEPYASYRNFAFPYLTGVYPVPRYSSFDAGLRLTFGL